ncbi:hydrolase 1, exosortase A system-associated [Zoogloea sp.]|uniref:hydrolase 1, exosortase A system-associated n=1 Tax=Zoogloea sp. TaxID=49181 RepID=UPI0025E44034|nr:hydrolase 1, exosortase A system-associated [Zoogloea sp.]MCK6395903.1 hydrolase 1, exosortase A system-associated [Zoogloea sp.]
MTAAPRNWQDRAVLFDCAGESLVGVVSAPEAVAETGVLVIVGGPQYRAGSHRQFVLLARHLAAQGVPCMRFDYRGMGDATGPARDFESVSEDVEAAIGAFLKACPGLRQVVLWGLCDGASAVCLYPAQRDLRVVASVLLNPWVHTQAGEAKVFLKHYYLQRITDPSFWKKLGSGQVSFLKSFGSLFSFVRAARKAPADAGAAIASDAAGPFPERMARGLVGRKGPLAIFLSGHDYVAREFDDTCKSSAEWRKALAGADLDITRFAEADHTFSGPGEAQAVAEATHAWLQARGLAR